MVTSPGIEPGITPWEGAVLASWPQGDKSVVLKSSYNETFTFRNF